MRLFVADQAVVAEIQFVFVFVLRAWHNSTMLDANEFEQLASLFEDARTLDPKSRAAYLDYAYGENPELREKVVALLHFSESDRL